MRVIVIGGTGHIGSFLTPLLAEAGHEVFCLHRGNRAPYVESPYWASVTKVRVDRKEEDAQGIFAERIVAMQPDVVIDLVCFLPESNRQLTAALRHGVPKLKAFLHCGTIWVHGPSSVVPTSEDAPRSPVGAYGNRKWEIERELQALAAEEGFPATVIHPGHIVGPGWMPLNPQGNFNPEVFRTLAEGEELLLPHLGLETVHHVHAADVSQVFFRALERPEVAIGQSFHAVSPGAVTLRGFAQAVAGWSGREAHLRFVSWQEFEAGVGDKLAGETLEHLSRSPNCSIEKGRRLLGYEPRYTSLEAVREAVAHLPVS